jgi:hypothetical protein
MAQPVPTLLGYHYIGRYKMSDETIILEKVLQIEGIYRYIAVLDVNIGKLVFETSKCQTTKVNTF